MHADVMELKSSAGKLIYKTCLKMEKTTFFFLPLADFTAYHIQGQLGVVSNFISLLEVNLDLHVGFVPVTCLEMCFKEIKSKSTQSKISVLTPDHQEYLSW